MAAIHNMLRRGHADSQAGNSHRYGTSVSNQRIECWWSHFRRGPISFLIQLFKDLVDDGHLDLHNSLDVGCCRFSFMHYVQKQLDVAKVYWNTHSIRNSRQQPSRSGIPDELFFLADKSGVSDFGKNVGIELPLACEQFVNHAFNVSGMPQLDEYLSTVMSALQLQKSSNWQDCLRLYMRLRDIAHNGSE